MYTAEGISNVLTGDIYKKSDRPFNPETIEDDAVRFYISQLRSQLLDAYFNAPDIKTVELFMAKTLKEYKDKESAKNGTAQRLMDDLYLRAYNKLSQMLMGAKD